MTSNSEPTSTSEDSLLSRAKTEYGTKGAKYLAVTVFNVLFGQALLILANAVFGWSYVSSNFFAVVISAGPAFVLSRNWVWQKTGKSHFMSEVVPFWSLAFLGLAASTALVSYAADYSDATFVLMGANLVAFGAVWVMKFFVLEWLFKTDPITDEGADAFVDAVLHPEKRDRTHDEPRT